MADFIRKQLTKGYGPDTKYRHIVYSLSAEEIIEGQRAFNKERKKYLELKQKAAKMADEEKASPFAKLTARAFDASMMSYEEKTNDVESTYRIQRFNRL